MDMETRETESIEEIKANEMDLEILATAERMLLLIASSDQERTSINMKYYKRESTNGGY